MTVKLLTEHHSEFLSFTGGCTGSSETTLVKMPHCWKSRVMAQLFFHDSQPAIPVGVCVCVWGGGGVGGGSMITNNWCIRTL